MSMSTGVFGIRPPEGKWKEMKRIYDACKRLNEDVPKFVLEFFNYRDPEPDGVCVELEELDNGCVREWCDEYRQGLEIEVAKLPKDVTIIRFYNAW